MGRRRRRPHWDKGSGGLGVSSKVSKVIEERLGHTKQVCNSCHSRNSEKAESCRNCGNTDLRRKAREFRDE